jgi:hypothetical protein
MLPPISSMEPTGPRPQHDNVSSVRHQYSGNGHARHFSKQTSVPIGSGAGKRPLAISTATSADSSDVEEDAVELPAQGLVAPWEVLRGLADVAIQKPPRQVDSILFMTCVVHARPCLQENGEVTESQSHTRSPSPDPRSHRPNKKRKTRHPTRVKFPDGKSQCPEVLWFPR